MTTNLRPISASARREGRPISPPERNCPATEQLRRRLQNALRYGDEARLAEESHSSGHSVAHGIEGSNRLSADLLRAACLVLAPAEAAAALSEWLADARLLVTPLSDSTRPASLIPTAASVVADSGRLAEVAVLAAADGRITQDEADAIGADAARVEGRAASVRTEARRLAR